MVLWLATGAGAGVCHFHFSEAKKGKGPTINSDLMFYNLKHIIDFSDVFLESRKPKQ